ncbi:MAG: fibronectin type III domain-containing protein [Candidatus Komeilibacteria bacterium]
MFYSKEKFNLILFFGLILLIVSFLPLVAKAEIVISNIEVVDMINRTAHIKWSTYNNPTKGIVYYGLTPDQLDDSIAYGSYDYSHDVALTGLLRDQDYYYRILAIGESESVVESYVQLFSTDNMVDTQKPEFDKQEITQIRGDAIVLYWTTNENTKGIVYYGTDSENLDKYTSKTKLGSAHEVVITNMERGTNYYLRIKAIDEDDNEQWGKLFRVNTYNEIQSTKAQTILEINNFKPQGFDDTLIFPTRVVLSWWSNLAGKSRIYYGTSENKLSKKMDVTLVPRSQNHKVVLVDLLPETTYYYKVEVYDAVYGKKLTSAVRTFETAKESREYIVGGDYSTNLTDSDLDGLEDSYEIEIGTDPTDSDSDDDGYSDKIEVDHGYDPLGPGKRAIFAYVKPRINNAIERVKASELRDLIESQIGKLRISVQDWYKLVNAYIYGEYPVEAIIKAIQYSGKTVHPEIPWQSWSKSLDYQNYINK